jgi:hypothetical protein
MTVQAVAARGTCARCGRYVSGECGCRAGWGPRIVKFVALIVAASLVGCGGQSTYDRAIAACGSEKKIAQLSDDGFRCKKPARSGYDFRD